MILEQRSRSKLRASLDVVPNQNQKEKARFLAVVPKSSLTLISVLVSFQGLPYPLLAQLKLPCCLESLNHTSVPYLSLRYFPFPLSPLPSPTIWSSASRPPLKWYPEFCFSLSLSLYILSRNFSSAFPCCCFWTIHDSAQGLFWQGWGGVGVVILGC